MSEQTKNSLTELEEMLFGEDMSEIVDSFIVETEELLQNMERDFMELEEDPYNEELLNSVFRVMHTIKGTSSFLGLEDLSTVAHRSEDILNKVRNHEMTLNRDIMDLLLESADLIKEMVGDLKAKKLHSYDIRELIDDLKYCYEHGTIPGGNSFSSDEDAIPPEESKTGEDAPPTFHDGNGDSLKKGLETSEVQKKKPRKKSLTSLTAGIEQTIRVDVKRLDDLMDLVGELVLSRNSLLQFDSTIEHSNGSIPESDKEKFRETSARINQLTTEIQMSVMNIRLLPISNVFNKFPRVVRDLARENNKKIELIVSGGETELDKSLIQEISDPLLHLVRNAVDHGIETPEERRKKGKPDKGTVRLEAWQEGNNIVIAISDDGKGMDPEIIKNKAIQKNLVTPEEVSSMSRREILNLIFRPGFSTAQKVTNVSGRGVGMDVVRTNIAKLKGIIDIDTETDKGSTFKIKLPLTLAITQGLLIGIDSEVFILPLANVQHSRRIQSSDLHLVDGKKVIYDREEVLPLLDLGELFRLNTSNDMDGKYVVVVGYAEDRLGLIADHLLGQEEIVIKSMGNYLRQTECIAGATILGDGRVRMILEIRDLFEAAKNKGR